MKPKHLVDVLLNYHLIESDKSSVLQPTKLSDSVLYSEVVAFPTGSGLWTPWCTLDKFPFTDSDFEEYSRHSHRNHTKTHIVVPILARVGVTVGRPTELAIVVPGTATQQLN